MWNRDEQTASEMLTKILWNSISYFDYGEDYFHGMLNGISAARGLARTPMMKLDLVVWIYVSEIVLNERFYCWSSNYAKVAKVKCH